MYNLLLIFFETFQQFPVHFQNMFKDGGGAHDGDVGNDGGLRGDEGCQGVVPTY